MTVLKSVVQPKAHQVKCTDTVLLVKLLDGRTISVPLLWFPRLSGATPEQLNNWELLGDGDGIHWPNIDEDLRVANLLLGSY